VLLEYLLYKKVCILFFDKYSSCIFKMKFFYMNSLNNILTTLISITLHITTFWYIGCMSCKKMGLEEQLQSYCDWFKNCSWNFCHMYKLSKILKYFFVEQISYTIKFIQYLKYLLCVVLHNTRVGCLLRFLSLFLLAPSLFASSKENHSIMYYFIQYLNFADQTNSYFFSIHADKSSNRRSNQMIKWPKHQKPSRSIWFEKD
jgi:hypothetical protein